MSSNNRITDNVATVAGPTPSTNGKNSRHAPSANGSAPFSPGSQNRGGQHPTPPSPADSPSANGAGKPDPSTNGHDNLGRFTKGNPGGPGNPYARMVAELRKAALAAVPPEKFRKILEKMSELALEGNMAAARFVAAYTVGKSLPGKDPDRVDVEEWQLMKEEAPMLKEVKEQGPIPDPSLPLHVARIRRYAASMDRARIISAAFTMSPRESARLFDVELNPDPYEVCNILRDKARHLDKPPSANGKRKKHRH